LSESKKKSHKKKTSQSQPKLEREDSYNGGDGEPSNIKIDTGALDREVDQPQGGFDN